MAWTVRLIPPRGMWIKRTCGLDNRCRLQVGLGERAQTEGTTITNKIVVLTLFPFGHHSAMLPCAYLA